MSPVFSYLAARGNDALQSNPSTGADIRLTTNGSSFLWAIFALVAVFLLGIMFWTTRVARGARVWHHLVVINLTIMTVAYFSMASNLGWTIVRSEFGHYQGKGLERQVFWVRYVDWILSVIFLILPATLASPLNLSDTLATLFWAVLTFTLRLVGALTPSTYKWGFFTMSLFSSWALLAYLFVPIRRGAASLGGDFARLATTFAGVAAFFLGILYPIAWALAEGGNVISVTSEMVFYAVLDILYRPVFLLLFLYQIADIDTHVLKLNAGKYTLDGGEAAFPSSTVHEHNEKALRMPHFKKVLPRRGAHDAPISEPVPVAAAPTATTATTATTPNPPRLSEATVHEQASA
ncbi:uncharacterized protein LOC62_01G001655 [Vanrija pseudolonga]|uniref:Family A G protein-coupled receptor-like protein n=1 Tax=Vanrija pseudolonga TaxID=143232 RepID=A0AAF1BG36_9TREE|nr:hypothetical protein LOC62_01G001655 [Vanrija pseudolonga]